MYAYHRICLEKKQILQTLTPHNNGFQHVTGEKNTLETSRFPWLRPSLVIFCILLFQCLMDFRYSENFSVAVPQTIVEYFDQDWVLYMFMRKYHSNQSMQFTCNRGGGVNVNIHVYRDVYLVQTLDEHTFVGFVNLKKKINIIIPAERKSIFWKYKPYMF